VAQDVEVPGVMVSTNIGLDRPRQAAVGDVGPAEGEEAGGLSDWGRQHGVMNDSDWLDPTRLSGTSNTLCYVLVLLSRCAQKQADHRRGTARTNCGLPPQTSEALSVR
jgi:hypothetical protein